MTAPLRLGTRASALALAQSGHVADALRRLGVAVEVVPLSTPGDGESAPLAGRAHEGIFVSSVRDALIDGAIDLAVHSYKDVPTDPADGLVVAAVPEREDPRDTVVSRGPGLAALPAGAIVGTCSVRRAAWVHRVRPDLQVAPIRGNIDQRVALVRDGRYDATLLAAAGLNRLGCGAPAVEVIALTDLVPAPAQGALALECAPCALSLPALGPAPLTVDRAELVVHADGADRYVVIGHPVTHSQSPLIHGLFARETGQDLVYEAIEGPLALPEPDSA
ncbi:MAG: hydroxymethylbilane synthase, partial [Actinomycetota bacterium]|nr:hydroxymethylbilane synthase [Actinomycetota bacterium]